MSPTTLLNIEQFERAINIWRARRPSVDGDPTKSSRWLAAMLIATPAEKTVPSGRGRSSPSRYRPSGARPVGQAPPPGRTVTHHATSLQVCRALLRKALRWQTPKRIRADTERRVVSLRALVHMAGTWQPNVA
ncbi:DUF3717 domain-containing protein [Burkholderia cepacia]|nr:DUF3717 domain-containing protein [Burkholderia cepacia]